MNLHSLMRFALTLIKYFLTRCRPGGGHSHTEVVRMLVPKNVEKGSIFGLVASSTFLGKRVLFR